MGNILQLNSNESKPSKKINKNLCYAVPVCIRTGFYLSKKQKKQLYQNLLANPCGLILSIVKKSIRKPLMMEQQLEKLFLQAPQYIFNSGLVIQLLRTLQ